MPGEPLRQALPEPLTHTTTGQYKTLCEAAKVWGDLSTALCLSRFNPFLFLVSQTRKGKRRGLGLPGSRRPSWHLNLNLGSLAPRSLRTKPVLDGLLGSVCVPLLTGGLIFQPNASPSTTGWNTFSSVIVPAPRRSPVGETHGEIWGRRGVGGEGEKGLPSLPQLRTMGMIDLSSCSHSGRGAGYSGCLIDVCSALAG